MQDAHLIGRHQRDGCLRVAIGNGLEQRVHGRFRRGPQRGIRYRIRDTRVADAGLLGPIVGDRVEQARIPLAGALNCGDPDRLALLGHLIGNVDCRRLLLHRVDFGAEGRLDLVRERILVGSLEMVTVPPVSLTIDR